MKNLIVSHPWLIVLAIVLGLLAAFLYYWKDDKFSHVKRLWVYVLSILRFLSIFLITLLLAGIMVKTISLKLKKPIVVVLQDNSQSIAYALDSTKLKSFLSSEKQVVSRLKRKFDVRFFIFDKTVKESQNVRFEGKYTDISGALNNILARFYNQNLGAVILVSDGIFNRGYSPKNLPNLGIVPVYTVLLGDTSTHKDLKISTLLTNPYVYQGNSFPLQVEVKALKLKGKSTVLKVFFDGQLIKSQPISINSNDFYKKFNFYIPTSSAGKKIVKVTLEPVKGEFNFVNNRRSTVIRVIKTKKKILILSNFPHPDIAALRRSLAKVQIFKVEQYLTSKFKGNLNEYNLIILDQIPQINVQNINILSQIAKLQKPVLFVCGTKCDYLHLSNLGLGIKIKPVKGQYDEAQPYVSPDFELFVIEPRFSKLTGQLPPLLVPFGQIDLVGDAHVLLQQKVNNVRTGSPLIVIFSQSPFNSSKAAVILGEGIWRWRITDYKINQNFDSFDHLMRQIVQFLAQSTNKKRFTVNVPMVVDQGDEVIFTAQVLDKSFQPVTVSDVKLTIIDSAGHRLDYLFDRQQDYYFLNLGKMRPGVYRYIAKTTLGKENFVEKGSFAVKPINIEAINLRADRDLLEFLADKTSGQMIYAKDFEQLPEILNNNKNLKPRAISSIRFWELIGYKWLFFLIIILLTAEWVIRKVLGNF